jgi:hypothetical protein
MTDYNAAEDRSNDIPNRFIPDGTEVMGNEYDLPPEEWACDALIHVCHLCGCLSRELEGHIKHSAEAHKRCDEHPMATCTALPADEWYWPEWEISAVEDLQEQLSDEKGAPNTVSEIVG